MLKKLLGIVCFFRGHKRGKFMRFENEALGRGALRIVACPRFSREVRYPVKEAT